MIPALTLKREFLSIHTGTSMQNRRKLVPKTKQNTLALAKRNIWDSRAEEQKISALIRKWLWPNQLTLAQHHSLENVLYPVQYYVTEQGRTSCPAAILKHWLMIKVGTIRERTLPMFSASVKLDQVWTGLFRIFSGGGQYSSLLAL